MYTNQCKEGIPTHPLGHRRQSQTVKVEPPYGTKHTGLSGNLLSLLSLAKEAKHINSYLGTVKYKYFPIPLSPQGCEFPQIPISQLIPTLSWVEGGRAGIYIDSWIICTNLTNCTDPRFYTILFSKFYCDSLLLFWPLHTFFFRLPH